MVMRFQHRNHIRSASHYLSVGHGAGWAALILLAIVVGAAIFSWHAGNKTTAHKEVSSVMQNANEHKVAGTSAHGAASTNVQVNTQTQQDGSTPAAQSHITASSGDNTSATVTINGETTQLPPNGSIDRSLSSNSNSTNLNVSVNGSSGQNSTSSSSVDIQVNDSSNTGSQ